MKNVRKGLHLRTFFEYVSFNLFTSYFCMKANERFCFAYQISTQPQYSYSQQAIDFVFDEIKKAPDTILDDLKEKSQKNSQP